jgi:hypothetical protein
LAGKPEGKRSLGRPRHREEDDIKMVIRESGWEGVERINLAVSVSCVWGREEVCTWFWWGNLREGDHWGDPGVDGRIILG